MADQPTSQAALKRGDNIRVTRVGEPPHGPPTRSVWEGTVTAADPEAGFGLSGRNTVTGREENGWFSTPENLAKSAPWCTQKVEVIPNEEA